MTSLTRDLNNLNTEDSKVKPIEEVLFQIKDLMKDLKTIRNDVSIIKNRIHELDRRRKEMEKYNEDNISKGWGYGWF